MTWELLRKFIEVAKVFRGTDDTSEEGSFPGRMAMKLSDNSAETNKHAAELLSRIRLMPEVREERVREIRFLIETGLYKIDPVRIAESMLLER